LYFSKISRLLDLLNISFINIKIIDSRHV